MHVFNPRGVALLQTFEGCKLRAYQDSGGVWTIGYGSTKDVVPGMTISQEDAETRFIHDTGNTAFLVDSWLGGDEDEILNENQFSAFVCFAFNVRGWRMTPLAKFVATKDVESARAHWLLYDKVETNGVKTELAGLKNRRQAELDLYLLPV